MEFITRQGDQFNYKGEKFRFVGINHYPLIVSTLSLASIKAIMDACVSKGIKVIRTWCFDGSFPTTDSLGNFRYLEYPLGTNLISNNSFETNTTGWTLDADFTRSNAASHAGSYSIHQVSSGGFAGCKTDLITVSAHTDYVYTFWYKMSHSVGLPPVCYIYNDDGGTQILDGGFNEDTAGVWKRRQLIFNTGAFTTVRLYWFNFGGDANGYYDDVNLSVKQTATLSSYEPTFVQLDTVLAEAAKRDLKLILSLADNNTNYNTKQLYCRWVDTIYGTSLEAAGFPYIGFFQNANCKTLYKDFVRQLVQRRNTINGRLYVNDDSIFSWELGNELRIDAFEGANVNTLNSENLALLSLPNGWADEMSRYIHSIDPNHMIGFGDMGHTWSWVNGDVVSNGTFYGVDYDYLSQLPYIHYLDFHMYPTQGGDGSQLQKYGQRLGFPNQITGDGFRAQIQDYIRVGHKNNKPVVCTEMGFVREVTASNTYYPLNPRYIAFKNIFKDFFDMGGDGITPWHGEIADGGTYTINLNASGGEDKSVNTDDTNLVNLINRYNTDYNIQKPYQRLFPYEEKQKAARPKSRKPFILDVFKDKEE